MGEDKITYSWWQIERAWKCLISKNSNTDDLNNSMNILSYWRSTHEKPLNIAFEQLQKIINPIDKKAIYANRLKRTPSIVSKLKRFDKMSLKNMQDVGWCRVVVWSMKKLDKSVKELKKQSNFKFSDWKMRIKDYIKYPKEDGYRCFHIVWAFGDSDNKRNIEIQVRTELQHDWATALEIVDLFTNQSLKSNHWDKKWVEFFSSISKILSLIESIHLFSTNNIRSIKEFQQWIASDAILSDAFENVKYLSKKLDIIRRFEAFTISIDFVTWGITKDKSWYELMKIDLDEKTMARYSFLKNDYESAENKYIQEEKESIWKNNIVVALVSTTDFWEIKNAYPNYFADSTEFIKLLFFILNTDI